MGAGGGSAEGWSRGQRLSKLVCWGWMMVGDRLEPIATLKVTPMGKPRMTQRDQWYKRARVDRYWEYKRKLKEQWEGNELMETFWIVCYIPMPKSWSKKKREQMRGQPHRQKPDADNITKAFKDSLYKEDSIVWDERCTKFWAEEGAIEVYPLDPVQVA